MQLTSEQHEIVHTWGKGQAVLAGAGCGKTTTLVMKCEELVKINPTARFAAVSFTQKSASDLKVKLGHLNSENQNWMTTIHGLCSAVVREFPQYADLDGEETVLNESEASLLWEQTLERIWFNELPADVSASVDALLARESKQSLYQLLSQVRQMSGYGLYRAIENAPDGDSQHLHRVAEYVLRNYQLAKKRMGVLDFEDLEKYADMVLKNKVAQDYYHRRFDLVMVDEFQDTNPLQARIIWNFVRRDQSNLCIVGDPKQSIYRFRDADVSVFEEFCSKLPVNQKLTANYRSRPGIIDFVNQVSDPAFEASNLTYEPLRAAREKGSEPAVVLREISGPENLGHLVAELVNDGTSLSETALLLRKIRGNEKWLKALVAQGIPVALGSGGLFWDDPRVRELASLLKWWDNPGNRLSGAVFLRSPWIAVADEQIDEWIAHQKPLLETFLSLENAVSRSLAQLRGKVVRPGEVLLSLLEDEKVERDLGNVLISLWHRVEELSNAGLDFHAAVVELQRSLDSSKREKEVPPPSSDDQLNVLTFHGAKGLEFSKVILIDLGDKPKSPNAPLLFWDRHKGAHLSYRGSDGKRDLKSAAEKDWRKLEKEKNLAESKRVFYVALTRAKDQLILCLPPLKKEMTVDDQVYLEDNWRGWIEQSVPHREVEPVAVTEFPRGTSGDETNKGDSAPVVSRFKRLRHSVTELNLLAKCPLSYRWTYIDPQILTSATAGPDTNTNTDDGKVDFSQLGSQVHAALEVGDQDRLLQIEQEWGGEYFNSQAVTEWLSNSDLMKNSDDVHVWNELPFEVLFEGEVVIGTIDRLIWDEKSGELHLIDYKITQKSKSVDELKDAYAFQMKIYLWAAERMLGKSAKSRKATIVNISPQEVRELLIDVPSYQEIEAELSGLLRRSQQVIDAQQAGDATTPIAGPWCRYCSFAHCPKYK